MKFVSVFVCLLLLTSFVFADNQVRITELQGQVQIIIQKIQIIQAEVKNYNEQKSQEILQLNTEGLKLQGAIEELQKQDTKEVK